FSVRWRDGALAKDAPSKGRAMVDYKEILEPADFACFVRLRELRKELAKKEEVPAYAIFTNINLRFIDIICSRDFLRSSNWGKVKEE
ncbi:HRDC domain-containing protein, partial [Opitutales bacterium]|nr:HRDC domain-containing protein [Opitutales bacterium]